METKRFCRDCGRDISDRGFPAKRCVACAEEREARLAAERKTGANLLFIDAHKAERFKQCQSCVYFCWYGYCDYASRTGHTRSSLHPPGTPLNSPCREYSPKGGKVPCMNERSERVSMPC